MNTCNLNPPLSANLSLSWHRQVWRILLIVALSSLSHGCATKKLAVVETKAAASYASHQSAQGLMLALDPMLDTKEAKRCFGTDLLANHILAVQVVAENKGSSGSYLLSHDAFILQAGLPELAEKDKSKIGSQTAGEAVGWTAVAVTPASLAGGFILIGVAVKLMSDATVVKHNFNTRQLQTTTLSPGETASGFVYFQIPRKHHLPEAWTIHASIPELSGTATNRFVFPFKTNHPSQP